MGTPTFLLNAMEALSIDQQLATAGTNTGDTTMSHTHAELAELVKQGDVKAAAEAINRLTREQRGRTPIRKSGAEILREALAMTLDASIAAAETEGPTAPEKTTERKPRQRTAATALAERVKALAGEGDRIKLAVRASHLCKQDPDISVEDIAELTDEDCLAIVSRPIRDEDTVLSRLVETESAQG